MSKPNFLKFEDALKNTCIFFFGMITYLMLMRCLRLLGQAVKTSPFHGGNTGSIPVGVIFYTEVFISLKFRMDL